MYLLYNDRHKKTEKYSVRAALNASTSYDDTACDPEHRRTSITLWGMQWKSQLKFLWMRSLIETKAWVYSFFRAKKCTERFVVNVISIREHNKVTQYRCRGWLVTRYVYVSKPGRDLMTKSFNVALWLRTRGRRQLPDTRCKHDRKGREKCNTMTTGAHLAVRMKATY